MIREWIRRIKDFPYLEEELKDCHTRIAELSKQLDLWMDVADEHEEMLAELDTKEDVNDAKYWNEKWQQSTVYYSAPKRKKVIDYVSYNYEELIDAIGAVLIGQYSLSSNTLDSVPLAVMKWVEEQFKTKQFKYKVDKKEEWLSPMDLLSTKVGDCDDYGILMYSIIRSIFKQLKVWGCVKFRLKCVAGNVNRRGSLPSSAGGHFYLIWLHSSAEWMVCETTYHRDLAIMHWGKKPMKLNPMYSTIWFTFNEEHSWAQHSITVSKKDWRKSKNG